MYLTEHEANVVLSQPYYSLPVTENVFDYRSYRGRAKVTVYTLRYNITPNFDQLFLTQNLLDRLTSRFSMHVKVSCSVQYDLLLVDETRRSYYIWRANSNRTNFSDNEEISLSITYANLLRFCQESLRFHTPDLNAYFASSSVSIARVLSIVYTFV